MKQKTLTVFGIVGAALIASVLPVHAAGNDRAVIREGVMASAPESANGSRLIVRYKEGSVASRSVAAKLQVARAAIGAAKLSNVRTAAGRSVALDAAHMRRLGTGADLLKLSLKMSDAELQRIVAALKTDPSVKYAQVDAIKLPIRSVETRKLKPSGGGSVTPSLNPDDEFYDAGYQWHFNNAVGGVRAPEAWDVSRGEGVVVAVLDTGILRDHPDMAGENNILEGYDFITDTFKSRRETADRVPGGDDLGDWSPVQGECYTTPQPSPITDSSWHGTHVAGTIAQLTNNGIGGAGLAHDAQILPVRVLGRCGGFTSDIVDAVIWASGGSVADVPDLAAPAEVINLSLGGFGACTDAEQDAFAAARARGSVVVVAAGNENLNAQNFSPGNCDNVINVGASRITGARAGYSNYGAVVDIAGPGGGGGADSGNDGWDGYVLQAGSDAATTPDSGEYLYTGYSGTSMASPHVAAVAALVQSALVAAERDPLAPADMEALLKDTARAFPVPPPASTPIGTGIVDAAAALEQALEVPCDPEVEQCEPDAIELTNQVAVAGLSGGAGSETLYSITVPEGVSGPLSIMSYGGSGNVSMYVSFEEEPTVDEYDARSTRPGNNETVRINSVQAGTYYIKLVGTGAYSNVTLQARHQVVDVEPPGGSELENGVPVTGISGAASSEQFWTINVPAGTASLSVAMAAGASATGDADLYVNFGAQPTTTTYECRPYLTGSNETCTIANPQEGTYHVMIRGFSAFTDVSLTGSY